MNASGFLHTSAESPRTPSTLPVHGDRDIAAIFCGIEMSQKWCDLQVWECIVATVRPALVLELGTAEGGLSLYLALLTHAYGARFCTFDYLCRLPSDSRLIDEWVRPKFYRVDVFSPQTQTLIKSLIDGADGPVVLLCDNGNKAREYATYSKLLRSGDVIGVHDYGTEVAECEIDEVATPPFMRDVIVAMQGPIYRHGGVAFFVVP